MDRFLFAVTSGELGSAVYVEKIGHIMFAAYLVSVILVLVNILIAMMSNTFEAIQVHSPLLTYCTVYAVNVNTAVVIKQLLGGPTKVKPTYIFVCKI